MEKGTDARQKLEEAARDLFAQNGIEGTSLREISRMAGQGNTSALQYHFGDRETLLRSVLAPHQVRVDAGRASLLDDIESRSEATIREMAAALVRPSAAMLEQEGGKAYLRIMAEIWRDPGKFKQSGSSAESGLKRWREATGKIMPDFTLPLHRRFAAIQLSFNELGRRAATRRRHDHRLFTSDLIDLTGGILAAPVSDETERLLAEREKGRTRK